MRMKATWLVVGVVAAIAVAAGVDALRGEPAKSGQPQGTTEAEQPSASTTSAEPEAPAPDGLAGGLLYYTGADCSLRAAELPEGAAVEAPNWDECDFALSPDARRVAGAGSGWDPHSDPRRGRLFESADGTIQVSTNGGPE